MVLSVTPHAATNVGHWSYSVLAIKLGAASWYGGICRTRTMASQVANSATHTVAGAAQRSARPTLTGRRFPFGFSRVALLMRQASARRGGHRLLKRRRRSAAQS